MDVTCTCGTVFPARSSKARYCSDRCRKRKNKADDLADLVSLTPAPDAGVGSVERATAAELVEVGRLDSVLGQTCLVLARRLDSPGLDTGSAISAVAARLEATLAAAKKGAGALPAPQQLQDEVAARRARHGA